MMTKSPRTVLVVLGVGVLVSAIAGYIFFEIRGLVTGPRITVTEPKPGTVLEGSPRITLAGDTERVAAITLNDRSIFIDEEGHWSEQVILAPGYSVLELYASDRFGRERRELVEFVYHAPEKRENHAEQATTTGTTSPTS